MNKNTKTKQTKPGSKPVVRKTVEPKSAKAKPPTTINRSDTKLATVVSLLKRKEGATIEQLMKATGWQSHSVRGAMSGVLKKNRGLAISSSKANGIRIYRIAA